MSQYGAYGFAEHGYGYADILAHYYTGTALGDGRPGEAVRVLLRSGGDVGDVLGRHAGGRAR